MKKLAYGMLNEYEKHIYMKMHNENIEENNTRKYMEDGYSKAARRRGIIFPVGMVYHLVKGLYYQVKDSAEFFEDRTPKWNERGDFFIDMMRKYGCDGIDWAGFPPEPVHYFHRLIENAIARRQR